MKVHVAAVQMHPLLNEYERNVAKICAFIDETMTRFPETKLIVFPELATSGYECGERFQEFAELVTDPGLSLRTIGKKAAEHHVNVVYGMPERAEKGEKLLYNSSVLIGDDGSVLGVYRKAQLFDTEKNWFHPGSDYPVFDTSAGKIGLFICFDAFFPEIARIEALQGADLLVVSTNWEKPCEYDFDLAMSARSMDNVMPLVVANRVGADPILDFFGHSRILDPKGRVLASLDEDREGIIAAVVDYEEARKLREDYYTFFQDRQPETYGFLSDPRGKNRP